jgi:hypothetical protein
VIKFLLVSLFFYALLTPEANATDRLDCGYYFLSGRWEMLSSERVELVIYVTPGITDSQRNEQRIALTDIDFTAKKVSALRSGRIVKIEAYVPKPFKGNGTAVFLKLLPKASYKDVTMQPIQRTKAAPCGLDPLD